MNGHGRTGTAGRATPAGSGVSRVVPAALLVAAVVVGLRGGSRAIHWDGPLRGDWMPIGITVEAVLAALLIATAVRARRSSGDAAVAAKLRSVLAVVLSGAMIAVGVLLLVAAHLVASGRLHSSPPHSPRSRPTPTLRHLTHSGAGGFPVRDVLWALLATIALVGTLLAARWLLRRLASARTAVDITGFVDEDGQGDMELREAVESGRSALRELDDARAAIIACYTAMERTLADAGAARGTAETPDELLTRASTTGLVHGTAAGRLTTLFYEARFSSHPMDRVKRDAAERSLDELAAELREPRFASATTASAGTRPATSESRENR